jgi:hypothetical protein
MSRSRRDGREGCDDNSGRHTEVDPPRVIDRYIDFFGSGTVTSSWMTAPRWRRRTQMAAQIQRTSGPQPFRERPDGEFSWMIPLDGAPSRQWIALFNTPADSESSYMPSRVEFRDRGMVFNATEERIKEWVRHIDQWIATANDGIAVAEAQRSLERERQERGLGEARQRVVDADKYRNL